LLEELRAQLRFSPSALAVAWRAFSVSASAVAWLGSLLGLALGGSL